MSSTDDLQKRAPDHVGEPSVMARYATLGDARAAIESLEAHRVDGVDIVLAGWRARAAAQHQGKEGADGRFVRYASRSVLRGSALGAIAGALVGLGVAAVMLAVSSWSPALALPVGAGFGAGVGALVGTLIDLEKHIGFSDAWTLTLQDIPDGSIWVLLFDEKDRARETLLRTNPVEVRAAPARAA